MSKIHCRGNPGQLVLGRGRSGHCLQATHAKKDPGVNEKNLLSHK